MTKEKINSHDENPEISATIALDSKINAAIVVQKYTEHLGSTPLMALIANLEEKHQSLKQGDCQAIEEMLFDQANALQSIFSKLARLALNAKHTKQLDTYLRLALKAQSQNTRTLATLHSIKHPSTISFVKQNNIGDNLQVNNLGIEQDFQKKIKKSSNELLEEHNGSRLDTRTTQETICPHPHLETVR